MDETITICSLCGSAEFSRQFKRFGFAIVRCRRCHLLFVNPRCSLNIVEGLYDERYFQQRQIPASRPADRAAIRAFRTLSAHGYLRDLGSRARRGSLLDVGCGEGYFLAAAKAAGWETRGVEISPFAAEFARANSGSKVFPGKLRDAGYPSDFFSVVTLFDVVEHFYDPVVELSEVWRILRPGGLVYLLTPDVESIAARLMGRYWFELKPPEHLFYFSRETLGQLLRKAGFQKVETRRGGKVLTLEFITLVLGRTNPWLARSMRALLGWLAIFRKPIAFRSGFVIGMGFKPSV